MITEEQIARINELARKSKTTQGLTPEERREQADLRRRYLDGIRANLTAHLDKVYYVDEQGRKRKLEKREKHTQG